MVKELSFNEISEVNGGVIPLVAGAITIGKAFSAGFGFGVAVGSITAWIS